MGCIAGKVTVTGRKKHCFMCHRIPIFKLLHAHVLFIHVYKFHWDTSIFWWGQKILGPGCPMGTQVMWPKIPIFELAQHWVVIYHVWKFRWAEANPSKLIMSTPNKQTNKQTSRSIDRGLARSHEKAKAPLYQFGSTLKPGISSVSVLMKSGLFLYHMTFDFGLLNLIGVGS